MSIETILTKSYHAIKENPYIALPAAIAWLPSAVTSLLFAGMAYSIVKAHSLNTIMATMESDFSGFLSSAINFVSPYALVFLILLVISLIAYYYIRAAYPFIAKSINSGKAVSIASALEGAKSRFWAVLFTDALFVIIIFAGVILAVLAVAATGGLGLILGFLAALIGLVYLIPIGVVLDGVVVLGKKSNFAALKEAYLLTKNRKLDSWVFVIVLSVIVGIYLFLVSVLEGLLSFAVGPYAGILTLVLTAFSTAYAYISSTLYYLEVLPAPLKKMI